MFAGAQTRGGFAAAGNAADNVRDSPNFGCVAGRRPSSDAQPLTAMSAASITAVEHPECRIR
ncbi:MAG TPA: hypothetical protein VFI31_06980 [Pirellulales bacterium]|nr:hypothetical protein [Pirellulales bacterium]